MSLLAVGFGFSAATFNPFTIGVAQRLAGLPLFSGLWLRVLIFAAVYAVLFAFLFLYARRIEKNPEKSLVKGSTISAARYDTETLQNETTTTPADARKSGRALVFFCLSLLAIAVYITAGVFLPVLSDFSMPVIAFVITIGGLGAGLIAGYSRVFRDFGKGIVSFLPSAVLLMLAMSVKQIIVSGGIMDTLLQYAYEAVTGTSPLSSLLIIFLCVLCFDFFISGASSKAFLVIPLLAPLAELVGITRQSIVLAFAFGDGFSNMIFPTNAVLLIVLGIVGVSYMTWFKWVWKLEAILIAACTGFLILAHIVGYGPF
jgi:uncharacterized ion transporter superfamily protein YfcC